MSQYDTSKVSQEKRAILPQEFGSECPNCGEPFDAGSSGLMYSDEYTGTDVRAWVRTCVGPAPSENWFEIPGEYADNPFCYVHKDEHIDD